MGENCGDTPIPIPMPKTAGEFITVVAHFHRAEIARMAGWRDRLDRTTNWAITVTAAMLSVALSTANAHHGVLLFAMLLALLLLGIEARRYRFFDVYRSRVRLLEQYYYAQVFDAVPACHTDWSRKLGEDLRRPLFRVRLIDAMGRRLRRNYIWMFLILLLAWLIKISPASLTEASPSFETLHITHDIAVNASIGMVSGPVIITIVIVFYVFIALAALRSLLLDARASEGPVHV